LLQGHEIGHVDEMPRQVLGLCMVCAQNTSAMGQNLAEQGLTNGTQVDQINRAAYGLRQRLGQVKALYGGHGLAGIDGQVQIALGSCSTTGTRTKHHDQVCRITQHALDGVANFFGVLGTGDHTAAIVVMAVLSGPLQVVGDLQEQGLVLFSHSLPAALTRKVPACGP